MWKNKKSLVICGYIGFFISMTILVGLGLIIASLYKGNEAEIPISYWHVSYTLIAFSILFFTIMCVGVIMICIDWMMNYCSPKKLQTEEGLEVEEKV